MSANIRKTISQSRTFEKYLLCDSLPRSTECVIFVKPVNASFQLEKYQLGDDKGEIVRTEFKINKLNHVLRPKSFFATELFKVDADTVTHITTPMARS
jgi:hypothetical protein